MVHQLFEDALQEMIANGWPVGPEEELNYRIARVMFYVTFFSTIDWMTELKIHEHKDEIERDRAEWLAKCRQSFGPKGTN